MRAAATRPVSRAQAAAATGQHAAMLVTCRDSHGAFVSPRSRMPRQQ